MDIHQHLARKFLVLVDGSPEYGAALRFAARRAHGTGGKVALLLVIEPDGFDHWLGIGNLMKEEAHAEAERILGEASAQVEQLSDAPPQTHIREGRAAEEITRLLSEDKTISNLVLAAGPDASDPGPLISALGAGQYGFAIPVTIVPANLSNDELDALT